MVSLFTMTFAGSVAYRAASAKSPGDTETVNAEYESIGGWLILVGLGVFLSVFTTPFWFLAEWEAYFTWTHWSDLDIGIVLAFEVIVNSALTVLTIALAASFFTKRKVFPKLYIFISVCWILFVVADGALCLSLLGIPPEPEEYKELTKMVLRAAIWCPYMLISKRVKGTSRLPHFALVETSQEIPFAKLF